MVELDVLHTSDGELVVIHDDKVDRTTDGTGCVGSMTFAELRALDAGFGTGVAGTGLVVPTLAEVLDAVTIDVNIEIKIRDEASCPESDLAELAADVVAAIQGDSADRTMVVSSFEADVLTAIADLDPSIYLGFLSLDPADATIAAERGFDALNVLSLAVREPAAIAAIVEMGLDVNVWTENDPFAMEDRIAAGVHMVITDEPDVMGQVVADVCAREEEDGGGGCRATRAGGGPWLLALVLLGLVRRRRSLSPS